MERTAIIAARRTAHAALFCAAILPVACRSATGPELPLEERPVVLEAASPVVLSGAVGTEATPAPVVLLRYEDGTAARGVTVSFSVTRGGTVASSSAVTDDAGRASPGSWQLGTAAEIQSLTARVGDSSLIFRAYARAGPVAMLTAVGGDGQRAAAGATLDQPLRARALDRFGNPIDGQAVTFSVVDGGGTIAADTAFTNGGGQASSGLWALGSVVGRQHVRAQSGDVHVHDAVDRLG